jgi:KDO2-lipid IV(A) lauroyltransferase
MSLFGFVTDPRTIRLATALSQRIPAGVAYRGAWWLAGLAARVGPAPVRILRANVGQVLGPGRDEEVKRVTRRALANFLRGYYDLFRAANLPQEQLTALVQVPAWALDELRVGRAAGRGILFVFPHVGNFDLAAQAMAAYVPHVQVLTLPDPSPGFQRLNEMRSRSGAEITPLSPAALRQAFRTLRQGGAVATGGDRPVSELDKPIAFFGRPARVPSAAVRLALKTAALVVVIAAVWDAERGEYALDIQPLLEMERTGDEEVDLALNMRRVLDALERVIRRWVDQWFMFVPVWPELMED